MNNIGALHVEMSAVDYILCVTPFYVMHGAASSYLLLGLSFQDSLGKVSVVDVLPACHDAQYLGIRCHVRVLGR